VINFVFPLLVKSFTSVLVLGGVELIFFTVASVGLCFGFVLKTVSITQGRSSYHGVVLTQHPGLFCPSTHPTNDQTGGVPEAGRGHSWDSWPQVTKVISRTTGHHAQHVELGEEKRKGGTRSKWWHLSYQVTVTC